MDGRMAENVQASAWTLTSDQDGQLP